MNRRVQISVSLVVLLSAGIVFAGGNNRKRVAPWKEKMLEIRFLDDRVVASSDGANTSNPRDPNPIASAPPTGLTGFIDYHVNAGATQYIRVDRSNAAGNLIHVVWMGSTDSTAPTGPTRRSYYAYSSNGGTTWNTFGNSGVPDTRRSGFPSIDMLQGGTPGVLVTNHSDDGAGLRSFIYVDSPPGTGAFIELGTPALLGGDEPIWPYVASPTDGSIVFVASRSTADTWHYSRSGDLLTWPAWATGPIGASACLPVKANTSNRVAVLLNTSFAANSGVYYIESTNNGVTWPSNATLVFPPQRIVGPDTMGYTLGSDMVYSGNNLYIVSGETNDGANAPTDSAQITFWSQATGFVRAASKVNTPNVTPFENRATFNTSTLDMPSIGMSGTTIVVAYHAMIRNDTSANGYNCSDIFLVQSVNGGATWSTPRNLTNTRGLDERFVSVSPWNEPGRVNLVWQEDPEAGGNVIGDPGTIARRTRQVFLKTTLTGVQDQLGVPSKFSLAQNYPNPFNPSTNISYVVARTGLVTIKVYDLLGREVATLVNELKEPGNYDVEFKSDKLSSGIYLYKMTAGIYSETKKMMVLQ